MPWDAVYKKLSRQAKKAELTPPPKPLILGGWHFSGDAEKENRWKETVQWAEDNGLHELTSNIPDNDFYFSD